MSFPTPALTWNGISANNRIAYVSLIDTMQNYLYGVKAHMLAHGHSVLWSASGGTGPANSADHTDRWTSAATVTPRATIAAASQGWVVLTRPDTAQVLITFQGASDDIARISFSPGALFTLAGTTNQQPTASDEQVVTSAQTLINATTSADRLWFGWADSTGNNTRYAIARSGVFTGVTWGIEQFSTTMSAPAAATPAIRGFAYSGASSFLQAALGGAFSSGAGSSSGSVVRAVVSSVGINCQCGGSLENFGNSAVQFNGIGCEANGSAPLIGTIGMYSLTAGVRGKIGNCLDWWYTHDAQSDGVTASSKAFIQLTMAGSAVQGVLWPWDGATTPVLT